MVLEKTVKKIQSINNKLVVLLENGDTKVIVLAEPLATIETILNFYEKLKIKIIFKI